jgi:addiction module RelE/StbE family toxin
MKIILTRRVYLDLKEIKAYIGKDSIRHADEMVKRLYESISILETHPRIGRIVPELQNNNIRELIREKYRIIYKLVDDDYVRVITIRHSSRLLSFLN